MSSDDHEAFLLLSQNADVSQPIAIRHFLYFDDEQAARAVHDLMLSRGLACDFGPSPIEGQWGVYPVITEIVSAPRLVELRAGLSQLAEKFGGEYDGWEHVVRGKGAEGDVDPRRQP